MSLALAAALFLQAPSPVDRTPATREPGSELTVTLLTYETGGLVFERFGHNAIWLHDSLTGSDRHYDYGRFSFQQANFFLRFAEGKMWYSMGEDPYPERYIQFYASEGRKIRAQELDLTPAQRAELRDFLEWNIRPENAEYAYDYYLDNCSTRIRDALDRVLGGAIQRYGQAPSGFTWRDETRRLNQHNPFLYTGLMVALGRPVDAEMSRWGQMFLPIRLSEHLDSVQVAGPGGALHPLVTSRRIISEGGRWPVPARPKSWTGWYLLVGVLLGAVMALVPYRFAFLALATFWALVSGIIGLVITWLWAMSSHRVAYQNENLLLFNLAALALAIVLPSAVRGKSWARKPARRLASLVAGLAALGLAFKILPGFDQKNLELIALALPAHLGLRLGLRSRESS